MGRGERGGRLLFVLPALLLLLLTQAWPLAYSLWFSLFDWTLARSPVPGAFVGLGNYRRALADQVFTRLRHCDRHLRGRDRDPADGRRLRAGLPDPGRERRVPGEPGPARGADGDRSGGRRHHVAHAPQHAGGAGQLSAWPRSAFPARTGWATRPGARLADPDRRLAMDAVRAGGLRGGAGRPAGGAVPRRGPGRRHALAGLPLRDAAAAVAGHPAPADVPADQFPADPGPRGHDHLRRSRLPHPHPKLLDLPAGPALLQHQLRGGDFLAAAARLPCHRRGLLAWRRRAMAWIA